jgi:hypothetical protein
VAEHVAQRDLGELARLDAEVGDQGIGVLLDLRLAVTAEVPLVILPRPV